MLRVDVGENSLFRRIFNPDSMGNTFFGREKYSF